MREITLADLDAELAGPPEALVVLLYDKGSAFEAYAGTMAPAIARSHGKLDLVWIDTRLDRGAPARFGLSGGPGMVLFLDGKQTAAFAVPFLGDFGPIMEPFMKNMLESVKGMLPGP